MSMNTYIHKTDQRLRVRSDFIKSHPVEVEKLIDDLEKIDAIVDIKHKKYAGSVAITFDNTDFDCEMLQEILESHQWTESESKNFFIENAAISGTKSFLKGAVSIGLSRLLVPSVKRLIFN